ncbi:MULTISPECIES: multiple monosaccharide ABC transporter permease [Streptomyces]|uniref:Xylose transport system permease protein XylH n=2 Tax=Streptomyces alfalfae TaxID=1642299 RepID=A0ABN4VD89_9ACTN|nr:MULTISPECIES: multiple monosaccharide ABC transporter permease [Streptomyces]APY85386.1 sugar ABC transporter permease [Streptomyces alfalfae]KUL50844.1 sugar ABC transporter permease [Streptomyces sp. NRRL S-1521]
MTTTTTPPRDSSAPPPVTQRAGALLIQSMRSNMRQYGMLIALAFIVVLFQIWTDGTLLLPNNVSNLIQQNGYILILAIGMMIVIIAGHIDLSVGSLVAFVGAMSAVMMVKHDMPWVLALVLSLLIGAVAGAWQGFFIAYVGIPSFIVTLAGMLLFRGLTQIVLEGQSLAPFPDGFQNIAKGFIPEMGPYTQYHNPTLLLGLATIAFLLFREVRDRRRQQAFELDVLPQGLWVAKCVAMTAAVVAFTLTLASFHGVPVVMLIMCGLLIGLGYVMRNAVVGRHVYALGGNKAAAMLSGVKDKRVTFLVFVNMGVLAALAGCVYAARLNAGTPQAGLNFELEAIAASFIGGASMSGGVGTVMGAVIGGLVLGVLNNGMSLVGIGTDYQQVIKGLVLLAAVGFDVWNKRKVGR